MPSPTSFAQAGVLPPPETLAVFLLAAATLILTPGPDTLFVLTQGVENRRRGVRAALGVATGVLVHTLAVAAGLAALFRTVPAAADVVTYLGAAYLVVLGVQTVRGTDDLDGAGDPPADRPGRDAGDDATTTGASSVAAADGYRRGVLVNVLNPKVALFFLAFLPGFASSAAGMAALGGLYALLTAAYLSTVAVGADRLRAALRSPRAGTALTYASGTVLVALGVALAAGR